MKRSHRRAFLQALGGGLAALPFVRPLADAFARDMGEALPLRFLTMYQPHGIAAEYWAMQAGDNEDAFDVTYENCSLAPFDDAVTYGKSFKDRILIVEGVELMSAANGHDSAATILTGSVVTGQKPGNASLDQVLAIDHGLGASTRVSSIALSVGAKQLASGETLSFGPGGEPLSKLIDPVEAFDLLFTGFVVGEDPEAQAEVLRQRRLGQSIVDFVRSDVERLKARLAPAEQQKLDQHLTSLRELEKQFEATDSGVTCTPPSLPDAGGFPKLERYNGGEPYFDAITDAHIDILAQAVACDVTRFGTLYMADLSYAENPLSLPADNHAGVAHTYSASPIGHNYNPTVTGEPATWLPLAQLNRYSYSKVARLMQKLDAFGVLDSTLIYSSSDMGNPSLHSTRNVPTLLAGGSNGYFRMGRRIRLAQDCPDSNPWCGEGDADSQTFPNNRVLISIAQAFGVTLESFGTQPDPDHASGELSELT